jgi:hypothetical protein
MKWLLRVGTALTLGLILTMALTVTSLIGVMFTTHPGDPRAYALFGAVFFEVREKTDGALDIGVGLENVIPVVVTFIVLSAFVLAVSVCLAALRRYKRSLTGSRADS